MITGLILFEVGLRTVVFIFGAIVGSFINVVLLRKNTGETVVSGRSRCFSCNKTILWYDNIPLISYFALGGTCRHCHSKISTQYPLVEFLVGLLAVLVFFNTYATDSLFNFVEFLFYFGAFSALFVVSAYDARTKIIDRHLLNIFAGFALVTALMRWWQGALSGTTIFYDVVFAGVIWFFFWAMCYYSNETWMGRGDSTVAWWCALFLGYPPSLGAFLFSFWIGGIFGAFLLILNQVTIFGKKKSGRSVLKMQIPFAPFLALGTFIAWYFTSALQVFYNLLLW